MSLAAIGFLTAILEASATTVGAGMVLGGFVTGSAAIALGWHRSRLSEAVLTNSYLGGVAAVLLALIDVAVRYSSLK